MLMESIAPANFSVNGCIIPENTIVSIHPCSTHPDLDIYGKDAEAFRPEPWLEANKSSAKLMEANFLVVSVYCLYGKSHWGC